MKQILHFDGIKFDKKGKFEDIIKTPVVSDISYSLEVDLKSTELIRELIRSFPYFPDNKISHQDELSNYMN